jgi:hypothetical protein
VAWIEGELEDLEAAASRSGTRLSV